MTPLSPTKYRELLDRYASLSAEAEAVREQIVTHYDELWLEHLDLLKQLADLQMQNARRSANA